MIKGEKLGSALQSLGYYTSPKRGPVKPFLVGEGLILFELITEGAVYGFDENRDTLHGVGSIFAHGRGCETVSRTEGEGHYACLTAWFRSENIEERVDWQRQFLWDDAKGVREFANEMLLAFHSSTVERSVIGELVWSQFRFRMESHQQQATQRGIPPRIAAVSNFMENRFAEQIGIDDLAAEFGLSASHLHALFREHLGVTPHQHLIHTRMKAAGHLLVASDAPVKSVALDVGYTNTENFCRAFKKYYGKTAASYRRQYRTYG